MTKIEWTDESWNPVTGCTKIAEGCGNCYAERMSKRLAGRYGYPSKDPFKVTIHRDKIPQPIHWKSPRMIFVCSMSDLFHDSVPDEIIDIVFAVMAMCPRHTFQILTKRPKRMCSYLSNLSEANYDVAGRLADAADEYFGDVEAGCWVSNSINKCLGKELNVGWPLKNLWIGTSISTQEDANSNIPSLLKAYARLRFVSIEPLLSKIVLPKFIKLPHRVRGDWPVGDQVIAKPGIYEVDLNPHGARSVKTPKGSLGIKPNECEDLGLGINFVIVGAESGPRARPMDLDWARSIRDQCIKARIPFFLKQAAVNGKLESMPMLDGKIWNQMPEINHG